MNIGGLFACMIVVASVVSCGQQTQLSVAPTTESSPEGWANGPGTPNWDNPILGDVVPTMEIAAASLAFTPLATDVLGTPSKILVQLTNPDVARRQIALLYDTIVYGRVIVMQWLPQVSAADYAARLKTLPARIAAAAAAPNARPGGGHAELVTIRTDIVAALTEPDDRSLARIRWVEGSLVVEIQGPDLQRDDVIAIANAL